MKYGLQANHKMIGEEFTYTREGRPDIEGVCDRVEVQPATFRNVTTGAETARRKIRFRLKPELGRAMWTDWFPLRPKKGEVLCVGGEPSRA